MPDYFWFSELRKCFFFVIYIRILSEFAKWQPQAAYAAFCFGEQNRFNYFLRTIPGMNEFMKPVDEIIQNEFFCLHY